MGLVRRGNCWRKIGRRFLLLVMEIRDLKIVVRYTRVGKGVLVFAHGGEMFGIGRAAGDLNAEVGSD